MGGMTEPGTKIELFASATKTSSNTATISNKQLARFRNGIILLSVTAAGTTSGDTLNVYLQRNVGSDESPVWDDMVSFTQLLGNGGAKTYIARISSDIAPTTATEAPKDASLTAGSVSQGPWSNLLRVKWVIGGSAPTFTFNIQGTFMS
jgi:hypothetical protein